jgi:predicted peptidase
MKARPIAVMCCIAMAAMLALAQSADEGYQMAKVVAFEHVAADAQHMENSDRYKISMRLGDTVYACRASAPAAVFNDWTMGKEFPAKLNGKVLLVKNSDGQVVELNIVGKKTQK